jgi:hypothetical protein
MGDADHVEGLALDAGRLSEHRHGGLGGGEADLVAGQVLTHALRSGITNRRQASSPATLDVLVHPRFGVGISPDCS